MCAKNHLYHDNCKGWIPHELFLSRTAQLMSGYCKNSSAVLHAVVPRIICSTVYDLIPQKFRRILDLLLQKFCSLLDLCCRNYADPLDVIAAEKFCNPLIWCCRNSATPWSDAAEILQPLNLMLQKFCSPLYLMPHLETFVATFVVAKNWNSCSLLKALISKI